MFQRLILCHNLTIHLTKSILMKKKAIYISDLHFEHVAWNKELDFQKDELRTFRHRLEEVAPRYKSRDILRLVEQFQNKFIRHFEVIDTLQHEINNKERELSNFAKENPIASNHVHFDDHSVLRDKVESQLEIYKGLKKKFMRFLTETM